jgi:hypothetical protein
MRKLRKLLLVPLVAGALALSAVPTFASNVCPVTGGPDDSSIHGTPASVPDKSGNPAHGADPNDPQPGDAFWN